VVIIIIIIIIIIITAVPTPCQCLVVTFSRHVSLLSAQCSSDMC